MKIDLYSNKNQECERVVTLLEGFGIEYKEYFLDVHFNNEQFCGEFGVEAEYPQVNIDNEYIGGLKDMLRYMKQKKIIA
jgi:glutaredoxin